MASNNSLPPGLETERTSDAPKTVKVIMALIVDADMEPEILSSLDCRYTEMIRHVGEDYAVIWAYGEAAKAVLSFGFNKLLEAMDRVKKIVGIDLKSLFKRFP